MRATRRRAHTTTNAAGSMPSRARARGLSPGVNRSSATPGAHTSIFHGATRWRSTSTLRNADDSTTWASARRSTLRSKVARSARFTREESPAAAFSSAHGPWK